MFKSFEREKLVIIPSMDIIRMKANLSNLTKVLMDSCQTVEYWTCLECGWDENSIDKKFCEICTYPIFFFTETSEFREAASLYFLCEHIQENNSDLYCDFQLESKREKRVWKHFLRHLQALTQLQMSESDILYYWGSKRVLNMLWCLKLAKVLIKANKNFWKFESGIIED